MVTEQDWPLEQRIRDCFNVLENLSKYRNDALFQPSPFHVRCSLSAAKEALDILVERWKKEER